MLNIGCHLSIGKGYENMVEQTKMIGANTFQFFTRNPRGGKAKDLDKDEMERLNSLMEKNNIKNLLAHGPYTMNLCSKNEKVREFAKLILKDDMERLEKMPVNLYVFHPGSHTGIGEEKAIEYITEALNEVVTKDLKTNILLETMSGKGTEVGKNFEQLRKIIEGVKYSEKIGICLDTCHLYSAGYDIVNNLDYILEQFDTTIGLDKIKAVHLNDSKTEFNSNKDRHEKIGMGTIGFKATENLINHKDLKNLPFFLETPNELDGYKIEIEKLKEVYI